MNNDNMNPEDSIDWRGMGDIFNDSTSNAHHGLGLPDALDLDATIPDLDIEQLQDAPPAEEQGEDVVDETPIYVTIPEDGSPDEIEVAPIVTRLHPLPQQVEDVAAQAVEAQDVAMDVTEDLLGEEASQVAVLACTPTPEVAPVVTKLVSPSPSANGDVPSVVKVEDAIVSTSVAKTGTPKRARVPAVLNENVASAPPTVTITGAVSAVTAVNSAVNATATANVPAGVTKGKVEKPALGRSLKEKREREAKQFPKALLSDLNGTTSAEVRKMSQSERDLVLYKRKLRNRLSARRSRQKRQATLSDLHEEIGELINATGKMMDVAANLTARNKVLTDKLEVANAEIRALKCFLSKNNDEGAEARKVGA